MYTYTNIHCFSLRIIEISIDLKKLYNVYRYALITILYFYRRCYIENNNFKIMYTILTF